MRRRIGAAAVVLGLSLASGAAAADPQGELFAQLYGEVCAPYVRDGHLPASLPAGGHEFNEAERRALDIPPSSKSFAYGQGDKAIFVEARDVGCAVWTSGGDASWIAMIEAQSERQLGPTKAMQDINHPSGKGLKLRMDLTTLGTRTANGRDGYSLAITYPGPKAKPKDRTFYVGINPVQKAAR